MSYNVIGYLVFISVIIFIIAVVGNICYKNGNIFVSALIPNHADLCLQINKCLLIGYYLVNIGYCGMTLAGWEQIDSTPQLIEVIAIKTSIIICILSALHYFNIIILTTSIQKLIKAL